MVQIFAAVDAAGATRFIADVPRGAACGCVCMVCGAPLIARQGEQLDWHFAHEGGQERPLCLVGALNLLRRLAVEEIGPALPVFAAYSHPHPEIRRPPLRWTEELAGPLEVLPVPAGPTEAAATVATVRSGRAQVHVVIGREPWPTPAGVPLAVLALPMPDHWMVRSEELARAFAREHMRLTWAWLPDVFGVLRTAQAEVRQKLAAEQALRAREAGQRWAKIARGAVDPRAHHVQQAAQRPPLRPEAAEPPAPRPARQALARPVVSWAPGLAGDGSIQFRRLADGTQWVLYPAGDHWRVAPVPAPFDGWDEYFPPSVAVPGGDGWLTMVDEGRFLNWISARAVASRIDSDPAVIEPLFMPSS